MTTEAIPDSWIIRWRRRMRTVQAAAGAGVVAAIGWSIVLANMLKAPGLNASDVEITEYYADLQNDLAARDGVIWLTLATTGFMWFMGVIRDRVGKEAPRLYGTVFLSGGIVFSCVLFAGVAALASPAVLVTATDRVIDPDTAAMTRSLASVLLGIIAPRIAAVVILSFSTLALRTGAMPKWIALASYLVGLLMLMGVTFSTPPVYLFPSWVGFVSLVLLLHAPARHVGES